MNRLYPPLSQNTGNKVIITPRPVVQPKIGFNSSRQTNNVSSNSNTNKFPLSKLNFYHRNKKHQIHQQQPKLIELLVSNEFVLKDIVLQTKNNLNVVMRQKQINIKMKGNLIGNTNIINPIRAYPQLSQRSKLLSKNKENNHYNQPLNQEEEDSEQNLFVFDSKTYNSSRKQHRTFQETFKTYERSTSRSNSRNKRQILFGNQKKVKSQIKIGTINSQMILAKLHNTHGLSIQREKQRNSFDDIADDSTGGNYQRNFYSRNAVQSNNVELVCDQQHQPSNLIHLPFPSGQQHSSLIRRKQSQFSFDRKNNLPYPGASSQLPLSKAPLHTIEQVQQSIRSIQLPNNTDIDYQLNRKISDHFQEIKQNMLKQLVMRSRQGKHIDNQSMSLIVEQIQQAANSIMLKYCQKEVLVSVKNDQNGIQFSITESQRHRLNPQHVHYENFQKEYQQYHANPQQTQKSKSDSIIPLLQIDVCGSDEKGIKQKFLPQQSLQQRFNSSKQFQQTQPKKSSEKGNIISEGKQISLQNCQKLKFLNYEQSSKGHSSISSIHQESSFKDIEKCLVPSEQTVQNKAKQTEKNNDSMKGQVQSLNKYTFLKNHAKQKKPEQIYKYQQKQLADNEYKVSQQQKNGAKVFTVKYDLKILQRNKTDKRKPTQVYRLSPFKFRKKQEVVQEMVRNNFIHRESQSFVRDK